jgi:preprotein translocase subunit Sss1
MYHRHELSTTLSSEEITRTLLLCGIPEKEEYTEDEADRFRKCLHFISSGKTDPEIVELLNIDAVVPTTETDVSKSRKVKKSQNPKKPTSEPKNIYELLSIASKQVGAKISLTESLLILQACGLPDSEEYSQESCDRFLEASDLIKCQGKSAEEVASYFGCTPDSIQPDESDFELSISQVAAAVSESGQELVDEMMRYKALEDASDAPGLYLKHLASEFSSPEFQQAWRQMEETLKATIVGKLTRRVKNRTIKEIPQTKKKSILPSISLPPTSENGS